MPWEQRLCICPDGDFYAALRSAQSSSVTGTIDMITTSSIKLTSGEELHPDIIVTATGLKLRMAGGSRITVASEPYEIRTTLLGGRPCWRVCLTGCDYWDTRTQAGRWGQTRRHN
ncbi:hypothetical protein AFGD_000797 [Aspergillus flavus]|nr:hypothetical protein AFGD_000797 [Aspergillus flavus]